MTMTGQINVRFHDIQSAVDELELLRDQAQSYATVDLGFSAAEGPAREAMEDLAAALGETARAMAGLFERTAATTRAAGIRFKEADESAAANNSDVGQGAR